MKSDTDLLAQCDVHTFRSSGPGGQNLNKRDTAVRLVHRPTGIVVMARDERSQHRNKSRAIERLRRRLKELHQRRRPRVATRVSRNAKARRVDDKRHRGKQKRMRKAPNHEN